MARCRESTLDAEVAVFRSRSRSSPRTWCTEAGATKTVAVAIGPEFGTVGPELIREAANEAVRIADLLVVCGFTFDPLATILEADVIARRDPRIREVHPEVSFRALADEPFPEPKSSWAGVVHRRLALERAGIVLPEKLGDAGEAGVADILDAAAAAWSAHQIASGEERSFPSEPSVGADGHVAAIWY